MHLTYQGGPCLEIGGQGVHSLTRRLSGSTGLPSKDGQQGLGWNFETRTSQGVGRGCRDPSIAHKNRLAAQFPTRECPYRFGRLGPSIGGNPSLGLRNGEILDKKFQS
ncbi:hypothetical protein K438DRAFT_1779303 [Mycena galopus ATCC 62051]|nr:hypothetical protein K438DRAFT_1779303 [Mycena galopus ATCC 62051]